MLILPKLICCDEAGFTGDRMLDPHQPHFSYASHDLDLKEVEAVLARSRHRFPVQMPELKATRLLKTERGRDLLHDVLEQVEGRYIASIIDKRLSLMAKLFEYIYEPVLQSNNLIFYRNNFHKFVANFLYFALYNEPHNEPLEGLAAEFEAFIRSLDPARAPTLLGSAPGSVTIALVEPLIRFARGYNVAIARETRGLQSGKWILDLSSTALFSHLTAWGERHEIIEVVCDDSKPLRAQSGFFDCMINRPDRVDHYLLGPRRRLTWNMSKPVEFVSSTRHRGVQLADLVAGVVAIAPHSAEHPEIRELTEIVGPHLLEESIMPDYEVLDLDGDEAPVNWLVLEELACRADVGADPLEGISLFYQAARESLPHFRAISSRQDALQSTVQQF